MGSTNASKGIIAKGTIVIRIYHSTYRLLRHYFKALPNESMASYFYRLSKWIEQQCENE